MTELTPPPSWTSDALCAQTDPELFYPEHGSNAHAARAICAACTVRPQCLDYALTGDERHGVFGGLSYRQRLALRKAG